MAGRVVWSRTVVILAAVAAATWLLVALGTFGPSGSSDTGAATGAAAEEGKSLFVAKGCSTCHAHAAVADITVGQSYRVGPTLTHYRGDPEFLRRWLKDPASVRPGTAMPNLGLSEAEIEKLVAFLTRPE